MSSVSSDARPAGAAPFRLGCCSSRRPCAVAALGVRPTQGPCFSFSSAVAINFLRARRGSRLTPPPQLKAVTPVNLLFTPLPPAASSDGSSNNNGNKLRRGRRTSPARHASASHCKHLNAPEHRVLLRLIQRSERRSSRRSILR